MVAGHRIDDRGVDDLLDRVVLVIAHNADFDRRFLEKRLPTFVTRHRACSRSNIDWKAEGIRSASRKRMSSRPEVIRGAPESSGDRNAGIATWPMPIRRRGVVAPTKRDGTGSSRMGVADHGEGPVLGSMLAVGGTSGCRDGPRCRSLRRARERPNEVGRSSGSPERYARVAAPQRFWFEHPADHPMDCRSALIVPYHFAYASIRRAKYG
jgi:hypothetical protein